MRGIALSIIGLTLILNMRLALLDPNLREEFKKGQKTYTVILLFWLTLTLWNIVWGW